MPYRKGQQFTCPHCGKDSVVAVKTQMDGWTKVGEYFACALCQAKLEDVAAVKAAAKTAAWDPDKEARLAAFLGTEKDAVKRVVDDDGERRFCRDCRHLLEHPFKVYCLLHKMDVNPMSDCDRFERRQPG